MSQSIAPVRVLVVDDHEMVAQGLAEVLAAEEDMEVVGRAGTVRDGHRLAGQLLPDVIVMDYRLPDGDGLAATKAVCRELPDVAVVMVTASDHDAMVAGAIEAGCSAYVTKDRAASEVVTAVRRAASGEMAFPAAALRHALPNRTGARGEGALTPREREILQLLADGRATQQIADHLVLSTSTVRNHVQNIMTKLGAHSRLEAVVVAVRQGMVAAPLR